MSCARLATLAFFHDLRLLVSIGTSCSHHSPQCTVDDRIFVDEVSKPLEFAEVPTLGTRRAEDEPSQQEMI